MATAGSAVQGKTHPVLRHFHLTRLALLCAAVGPLIVGLGGDDIDQIMQCDEQEFLEIMSLVGMSSKPLHVRRLQRTLNVIPQFSLSRLAEMLVRNSP